MNSARILATRLLPTLILALVLPKAISAPPAGYTLAWADELDGTTLKTSKWQYRDLGERRAAFNVKNAISIADGFLPFTAAN